MTKGAEETPQQIALNLLNRRAYSSGELMDKLQQKGVSLDDAESACYELQKAHLLNDEAYASDVVRHYAAKHYGRGRIEQELYRRRVPGELWQDALAEYSTDEDTPLRLIEQKLQGERPDRAAQKRAVDMLYRRGFDWGTIQQAMKQYLANLPEDEDD